MNRTFFTNIEPGTLLFDRFELVRCLAADDVSAVYLCTDQRQKSKNIALKVISSKELEDSIIGERLSNELKVSGRIDHINVLKCNDFFNDYLFAAFSMPYMDRGTLASRLEHEKSLEIDEALCILAQLCAGLCAVHRAGIIHRDLKPENILLGSDGTAKISDFGISVIGSAVNAGQDEVLVGTINYLSPEYIQSGYYDQLSDIYSLGLIAYEMITGSVPVVGRSPLERLVSRVKIDLTPPVEMRRDCPRFLNDFIMRAVAIDRDRRFPSAESMLLALGEVRSLFGDSLEQKRPTLKSGIILKMGDTRRIKRDPESNEQNEQA